ncbi:MAG: helix-turn-helix transcriptional regulator [Erysipelotrichaceae bacterium]|nr:helix-turn-helix transcriptional regulator [Erysipelotrichaceae bacterium]
MIDFRKVGEKISQFRKDKNLSQDDLADRMYVSRQLVSKWENGMGVPKIDHIIDLCEILDVSFEELLCLNDGKETKE